jgi:rubrerythrin
VISHDGSVTSADVDPAFLADLRRALKAELGARSIYARLAPRMKDRELGQVLESFHADEVALVVGVRALLAELGASRVPRRSRSRAFAGWILAVLARGRSSSIAVRLCQESESTVARWYREHARYLALAGDVARAEACEGFAQVKLRHARILEAWVAR